MNKRKVEYLRFVIKDRIKFLKEVDKLSSRAKDFLINYNIHTYDSFYYHLFIAHDLYDFQHTRNAGAKTQRELINLMRTILNADRKYDKEIEKFDNELMRLNSRARNVLKSKGISFFETFYYKYAIKKEEIDFKKESNAGLNTRPELYKFVNTLCNYLGVELSDSKPQIYFNPKNPKIPFVPDRNTKKIFLDGFNNLSTSTRNKLIKMGADSLDGFYLEIISENSQFNKVLNKIGEQNLLEILRFRTVLNDTIKLINNP
jgi:hypothetical protein